ncbi:hypothetical protein V3W47_11560 [Deinococcus sp. YIM 134068]|uniref:hypothetical protein n=1 Tax=Deinococcus lichenicola TaxID=3118910 RepID=UPI002F947E6C
MRAWPVLAFVLSPLVTGALLVGLGQRVGGAPALAVAPPEQRCTQPPVYRVGYKREDNGILPLGAGFSFQGVAWLEVNLCSPGTLVLTADGEVAGGEPPVLHVALNSRTLLSESFRERRTLRLRIPEAGLLTLSYFNDYYRSEARVATLENFRVQGAGCQGLRAVNVPPETGGAWWPDLNLASLVSNVPMSLTPCGPGELTLRVLGRAGGGAFPKLTFTQEGRTLLEVETGKRRRAVRVAVTGVPVHITLTNPFFRQLADRNLNVRRLEFRPDPPTLP